MARSTRLRVVGEVAGAAAVAGVAAVTSRTPARSGRVLLAGAVLAVATHSSLRGSSRALAAVTAIIDGTGSAGAAVGPLLTGYISAKSWTVVFTMLMVAALVAGLLLSRLVMAEVSAKLESWRSAAATGLSVSSVEDA
ncbi:unnamed protein product [Urochloa humidicola]